MIEVEHVDMWMIAAEAHVITTNGAVNRAGEAVMGRGCAAQARVRFKGLQLTLGHKLQVQGNHAFYMGEFSHRPGPCSREWLYRIVTLPVKHVWNQKADTKLIRRSAIELVKIVDQMGWDTVVVPRPGCGNGYLNWGGDVRPWLRFFLDDRFIVVSL